MPPRSDRKSKSTSRSPRSKAGQTKAPIADTLDVALIDNLHHLQAALPEYATLNDWYMALAYTVRDRLLDRYLDTLEQIARDARTEGGGVSLGGVPDRAASRQQPGQPGPLGRGRAGGLEGRAGPVATPGAGGRAGPRQRRPRPARRLLHGLAGDARRAGDRLRHPLRVRHLRSGDSRRLAGGDHRQVAALRQPVGDRAAGSDLRREVRRPHRAVSRRRDGRYRVRWIPDTGRQGRRLRHAGPRLSRRTTTNLLRLWKAEATESFDFDAFNVGDYYGAVDAEGRVGNHLQGPLSERRARSRASSCGWRSSTSSSPARCRT